MKLRLLLASAAVVFAVLITANAGGYRFGVSDQAFYIPAVELSLQPDLFPADRALLAPQMRLWLGDQLFAAVARAIGGDIALSFAALYLVTILTLFAAAVSLARGLGANWWTTSAFLLALTLRHRITRTGVNTFEGHFHPRLLAFALGLAAFAALIRGRAVYALAFVVAATIVHTTTAAWFGGVVVVALLWQHGSRRVWIAAGGVGAAVLGGLLLGPFAERLTVMDSAWLAVFADRDYLFPADWPIAAWAVHAASVGILVLVYRRRRVLGIASAREGALVAGLLALVLVFAVSLPLIEARIAIVVQAQVNRVFWLVETVSAFYLLWLLTASSRGAPTPARAMLVVAIFTAVSVGSGYFILNVEADRTFVRLRLPDTPWNQTMAWLRTQPIDWLVLADPNHAWDFGASLRVAAARDTVLEANKDPILALYDRMLAARVEDRRAALAGFGNLSNTGMRAVAARFSADVLVTTADRAFDFPILHRQADVVVYDLR